MLCRQQQIEPQRQEICATSLLLQRRLASRALQALQPNERRLLYNRFVLGLSVGVLGRAYSLERSTVARRIQEALRSLQRCLQTERSCPFGEPAQHEWSGHVDAVIEQREPSAFDLLRPADEGQAGL